jgi:ATP-dependent Clp protease ATP-binding subunit ClpX
MARLTVSQIRSLIGRYTGVEPPEGPLHCSFCGKPESEVKKLIAGPDVFICDKCVATCVEILNDDNPT